MSRNRYWIEQVAGAILPVWSHLHDRDRATFVVVAARDRMTDEWTEEAFELEKASRRLRDFLKCRPRRDYDLYWSPCPFSRPRRARSTALSTPFSHCDFNPRRWRKIRPRPTIAWRLSAERYQGLWAWHRFETPSTAEAYSRKLAKKYGDKHSRWRVVELLRMPHTFNHECEDWVEIKVTWFDDLVQIRRPRLRGGKARR